MIFFVSLSLHFLCLSFPLSLSIYFSHSLSHCMFIFILTCNAFLHGLREKNFLAAMTTTTTMMMMWMVDLDSRLSKLVLNWQWEKQTFECAMWINVYTHNLDAHIHIITLNRWKERKKTIIPNEIIPHI
jgi:hypothetical protein